MSKALLCGVLAGLFVWYISAVVFKLQTHIGGDLIAAAYVAASVATSEERKRSSILRS